VAVRHVVHGIVILIIGVGLINGVVGEMHEEIAHIALVRKFIRLSGKSHKSLVVEIDSKGVAAGD
jgi:hypothetical protein